MTAGKLLDLFLAVYKFISNLSSFKGRRPDFSTTPPDSSSPLDRLVIMKTAAQISALAALAAIADAHFLLNYVSCIPLHRERSVY